MIDWLISSPWMIFVIFIAFFFLLWLASGAVLLSLLKKVAERKSGLRIHSSNRTQLAALLSFSLAVAVSLSLFALFTKSTTYVPDKTVIVSKDKKIILGVYPSGRYLLKNDDKIENGYHAISFKERRAIVAMNVSPITVNPKVRKIFYDVVVVVVENEYDAIKFFKSRFKGNIFKLEVFVRRQLYEFNEKHSKELAKFYNPLDSNQQRKFTSIVAGFLKPHLDGTGVKIARVRFDLL